MRRLQIIVRRLQFFVRRLRIGLGGFQRSARVGEIPFRVRAPGCFMFAGGLGFAPRRVGERLRGGGFFQLLPRRRRFLLLRLQRVGVLGARRFQRGIERGLTLGARALRRVFDFGGCRRGELLDEGRNGVVGRSCGPELVLDGPHRRLERAADGLQLALRVLGAAPQTHGIA